MEENKVVEEVTETVAEAVADVPEVVAPEVPATELTATGTIGVGTAVLIASGVAGVLYGGYRLMKWGWKKLKTRSENKQYAKVPEAGEGEIFEEEPAEATEESESEK